MMSYKFQLMISQKNVAWRFW